MVEQFWVLQMAAEHVVEARGLCGACRCRLSDHLFWSIASYSRQSPGLWGRMPVASRSIGPKSFIRHHVEWSFWSIGSHICHGLHGSDVGSNVCAGRIDWAEAHQVVGKSHADGRVMMPLSTHMAAVERDLRFGRRGHVLDGDKIREHSRIHLLVQGTVA